MYFLEIVIIRKYTTSSENHKIIHSKFLRVMQNVQQQLNNMMAVMSPTPAPWGKPTYTQ